MVQKIVRDIFFLSQKSEPATKQDFPVGQDLQDTLRANQDRCVGMAANMIGVRKKVIIVNMGFMNVVMYNPVIVHKDTPYQTEEGCLSLEGVRKTTRYQNIEVVLLHDYNGITTAILPDIIEYLQNNGYILLPLFYESNVINK